MTELIEWHPSIIAAASRFERQGHSKMDAISMAIDAAIFVRKQPHHPLPRKLVEQRRAAAKRQWHEVLGVKVRK
jgi:hypothetical protein